jgi:cell division protein FtsB
MRQSTNGWYWIGLLALVAGMAFYASERDLIGVHEDYKESEVHLQVLDEQVQALEIEKRQLERKVQGLGTDPLIVETEIRKATGRVRKGETVYRVELPENR